MSNGILIFAHNNQKIDYVKIACLNALMIQKNMHITNITLITDKESLTSTSNGFESQAVKIIKKRNKGVICFII